MRIFVYIATTQGPVLVRKITQEDDDVQSVVCLNHTADRLPITNRYHDFVKKGTGLIHRDFGHGAFRVDLSDRVTAGDSWQLGLYLAHAMSARGTLVELSSSDQALPLPEDLVVWATGAVTADREVSRVEEVPAKWEHSQQLFERCARTGVPVLALVPAGNKDDTSQALAEFQGKDQPDPVFVNDLAKALAALERRLPGTHQQAAAASSPVPIKSEPVRSGLRMSRSVGLGLVAAALLIVVASGLITRWVWPPDCCAPDLIELDDFGGRSADPSFDSRQDDRQPLTSTRETAPAITVDTPPGLVTPTELTLVVVEAEDADRCDRSRGSDRGRLGVTAPASVALDSICALGVMPESSDVLVVAVAVDSAQLLSVQIENGVVWIPMPRSTQNDRTVAIWAEPISIGEDRLEAIETELRRIRFAEFERVWGEAVRQGLAQLAGDGGAHLLDLTAPDSR